MQVPSSNKIRSVIQARCHKFVAGIREVSQLDHKATNGDLRESMLKSVRADILPKRFSIRSGFICDMFGNVSPQLDIIVIDNACTPEIVLDSDVAFVPIEAALVAIEVKSTLNSGEHGALHQVEGQISKVYSLNPGVTTTTGAQKYYNVHFMLFGFSTKLSRDYLRSWIQQNTSVKVICVLNNYTIVNHSKDLSIFESQNGAEEMLAFLASVIENAEQISRKREGEPRNMYHYLMGTSTTLSTITSEDQNM
jgi:hypothetical protein